MILKKNSELNIPVDLATYTVTNRVGDSEFCIYNDEYTRNVLLLSTGCDLHALVKHTMNNSQILLANSGENTELINNVLFGLNNIVDDITVRGENIVHAITRIVFHGVDIPKANNIIITLHNKRLLGESFIIDYCYMLFHNGYEIPETIENIFTLSAPMAYEYARVFKEGKFEKGEKAIACDNFFGNTVCNKNIKRML